VPCEFGSNAGSARFAEGVPLIQFKATSRAQIERFAWA